MALRIAEIHRRGRCKPARLRTGSLSRAPTWNGSQAVTPVPPGWLAHWPATTGDSRVINSQRSLLFNGIPRDFKMREGLPINQTCSRTGLCLSSAGRPSPAVSTATDPVPSPSARGPHPAHTPIRPPPVFRLGTGPPCPLHRGLSSASGPRTRRSTTSQRPLACGGPATVTVPGTSL